MNGPFSNRERFEQAIESGSRGAALALYYELEAKNQRMIQHVQRQSDLNGAMRSRAQADSRKWTSESEVTYQLAEARTRLRAIVALCDRWDAYHYDHHAFPVEVRAAAEGPPGWGSDFLTREQVGDE